jgi:hypothetical protein
MTARGLGVVALLLGAGACGPVGHDRPLEYKASRLVSDAVAGALVRGDTKSLFALLDTGFRTVVSNEGDLRKFLDGMDEKFGQPLEVDFKHSLDSRRVDGPFNRVSKVFWYAAKTTKYPKGKYFLKVEIVRSESGRDLVTSGFGLLTFQDVPKFLQ